MWDEMPFIVIMKLHHLDIFREKPIQHRLLKKAEMENTSIIMEIEM